MVDSVFEPFNKPFNISEFLISITSSNIHDQSITATSAEDSANESSDLTELDTEDEEVLEEEEVTGEEKEEKEGNKEPVSNDDMEHSVIVAVSGRQTRGRSLGSR